ncbi:MAG: transposase [bacterium]
MPQKNRALYPNQYFHVIARSNNHIYLFKEEHDFQKFLSLINHFFKEYRVRCFHYVLLNTHVHFLIKLPEKVDEIPDMMKKIFLKYHYFYKYKYGFEGSLWRGRYKAELIDTDRYMLGCGLYIENNPVKAGMVKTPEDYPWSSYGHWIGKRKDKLLNEHPLDVVKNYKEIAHEYMNEYIEYITLTSVPLGRPRTS